MCARNYHELLVLHIENFRERTAGCSYFVNLVLLVVAFWTDVFSFFHF